MSIVSLSPINRTAALVTGKGVHYEMNSKIHVEEFIGPPLMVKPESLPDSPSFVDLTGRKKGRFKVIGLMANGKGRWVVRCVCGTYTTRSAKSIKSVGANPNAEFDACRECMHVAYRKREEIYRRTGKDTDLKEVW